MPMIKLRIDDRKVTGYEGQTILEIAHENGIEIPTLCHDERVEMYGSCGLCTVEIENNPRLMRSCCTFATDGMVIRTNSERIYRSRKSALELLFSDHSGDCLPPCTLACPAQTDCQGYVGLIVNGAYREAYALIKDKIPLPASIGRVCPHPCEEACRREMVEEPISIMALKRYASDVRHELGDIYTHEIQAPTGKSIAVIGGGPGGLTAAYFLRAKGHNVTVYEALPLMGGMLRYGIPEYRLPKKILQEEIDAIEDMGVEFINNTQIGRDITLDTLHKDNDAVVIAIGAWASMDLGCSGEELDGVQGGVSFLLNIEGTTQDLLRQKVAVVGGGNTAMDACRTAVRSGASVVYNVYRRTRAEMPAEEIEIVEAEEEGVVFKFLTNPNEVIGENGKVSSMRLQIMELGEPDASGRRRSVPVPGKEETIDVDTIIVAIGQKPVTLGFDDIEQTKWGTIIADEKSFLTNIEGVFAIGDATNNGADIAITAIGEAQRAAEMIDRYLGGESLDFESPFSVKAEKTAEDFVDIENISRVKMPHRSPIQRKRDFREINYGYSEEDAKREAARCLECGCMDRFECKLISYADRYQAQPERYSGEVQLHEPIDDHPYIRRHADKCILCGLCVRICEEVVGAASIGLVGRGFETIVMIALDGDLRETDCILCGQCVHVCPTGALTETMMVAKQVPLKEVLTETVCAFCSIGCKTTLTSSGNQLLRSLPSSEDSALLCMKGRFGFGEIGKTERLTVPLIRGKAGMEEAAFDDAFSHVSKSIKNLQAQYGDDCIAFTVSGRYTNEEAFLVKEYAEKALNTNTIFSLSQTLGGMADVLGRDVSTATFSGLEEADLIVAVAPDMDMQRSVATMRIRRAVRNGAKLLLLTATPDENLLDDIATLRIDTGGEPATLEQIIKILLDKGCGADLDGLAELRTSVSLPETGKESQCAVDMIISAKKAVFIYERNTVTTQAARLIASIAALSGHAGDRNHDSGGSSGSGVIQLLPCANSQGLINLGFGSREDFIQSVTEGKVRGLLVFGEEIDGIDLGNVDFMAVQDLHMTEAAKQADVIFPASSYAETSGSFTAYDNKNRELRKAVAGPVELDNIAQIMALSAHAGLSMPYKSVADVSSALALSLINTRDKGSDKGGIRLAPFKESGLCRSDQHDTNTLNMSLSRHAVELGLK